MPDWQRFLRLFRGRWRLRGYDTYAAEDYPMPGSYYTERGARRAARRYLRHLERTQPSETSGGQKDGGIQDRIYVVRPDGSSYRYVR
jgi:hypothetical protein